MELVPLVLRGKTFCAKVTGLNDLLKKIGTDKLSEDMSLIRLRRRPLDTLLQPLTLL